MVANGVFEWVRPDPLVATQCNPNFNSVLDFVFAAGDARNWNGSSEILERQASYCNGDAVGFSDHRPVKAIFELQ